MDGTLRNQFFSGRRVRPATLEFAEATFPRLIVGLKTGRLLVSNTSAAGGPDVVFVADPRDPSFRHLLLREDFDICKSIASRIALRTFPTDSSSTAEASALAHVRVEFAGRGT